MAPPLGLIDDMYLVEDENRHYFVSTLKEREIQQILMSIARTGRPKAALVGGLEIEGM